jgi:nicotinate-nucleotide pyrophosphorylase (carboxylating)
VFALPEVSDAIARSLAEDLGVSPRVFSASAVPDPALLERDVTTAAVLAPGAGFSGRIVAREAITVAGLPVAEAVWSTLARAVGMPDSVEVLPLVVEGAAVGPGIALAEVTGPARVILAGERAALDFVMLLSGIATRTAAWQAAAGPDLHVCDTRKTVPGLRALSKYAVRVGRGTNHRMGLWDMVLVKDNHIAAAGGIERAVKAARARHPELLVQVEAETVEDAVAVARAGADLVLLDNMDAATIRAAVRAVKEEAARTGRSVLTEASGGLSFERLAELRDTGVDRVSTSAITLALPVDVGLDEA